MELAYVGDYAFLKSPDFYFNNDSPLCIERSLLSASWVISNKSNLTSQSKLQTKRTDVHMEPSKKRSICHRTRRKPAIKKGWTLMYKRIIYFHNVYQLKKCAHIGNILIIGVILYFMPSYHDPMSHMYCQRCDRRYPMSFTNCTICNGKLVENEYVE